MDTSRYAELFLTESREHLSAINHAMLELERSGGGGEAVGALFRAAHTLKGMSATMGYAAVTELTHELETLLERVRGGALPVTATLMDLLFAAADALEHAVEHAVAGRSDESDVGAIVSRLRAAAGAASAVAGVPSSHVPAAASAPEPADDVAATRAEAVQWSVSAPAGDGLHVRVRIAHEAPLRGVRAYLVVQKAKSLGDVMGLTPPLEALQADEFDREFAMRLVTLESGEEVARTLRAVGDVEAVEVAGPEVGDAAADSREPATTNGAGTASAARDDATPATGSPRAMPTPERSAALAPQRHVRIDLRRLDSLMNLIGELVITRGRLAQLATSIADPALDETVAQASRLVSDLQEEIMTSRMVPVAQVFDRFPRLVRDAARARPRGGLPRGWAADRARSLDARRDR